MMKTEKKKKTQKRVMMCQNICIPAVHEMQWLWPYHNPSSQMHLQGLSERKGKKKKKKKVEFIWNPLCKLNVKLRHGQKF